MRAVRLYLILLSAMLTPVLLPSIFMADEFDEDFEDIDEDELLAELGEEKTNDLQLLRNSCRTDLWHWRGVKIPPRRHEKPRKGPFAWEWDRATEAFMPVAGGKAAATVKVAVPEAGTYRIWIRRRADSKIPYPVKLDLKGVTTAAHIFGEKTLTDEPCKRQEKKSPVSFEDEAVREAFPMGPVWIWEYWDTELGKGVLELALSSQNRAARVTTVMLTQSKSFVPNLSPTGGNNTLERMYYRFRIRPAAENKGRSMSIPGQNLTYHWRFIPRGRDNPMWYSTISAYGYAKSRAIVGPDETPEFPAGQWCNWVDVTWSAGAAAGPWATARLGFKGIRSGTTEVQLAWYPHEGAAVKTIAPGVEEGQAVFMFPLSREVLPQIIPDRENDSPIWGMVRESYVELLETASDVHRRHLAWAEKAAAELGLPPDHPRPKRIKLFSGCGATPAARDAAASMLVRLGLTAIIGLPEEYCRKHDLEPFFFSSYSDWGYLSDTHDPADPAIPSTVRRNIESHVVRGEKRLPGYRKYMREVKLGDEIGAIASSAKINASADCRAHFHAYLRRVLADKGVGPEFFGVEDVSELESIGPPGDNAGLFERRLYYHSHLHKFALTSDYYRHVTSAVSEIYPNAHTYANFSPHPVVLGGQTMNHSEWFSLSRLRGASMAWGEDWASAGGTWGYHGVEVVSYYGAWVECAARADNTLSGFYDVLSCGSGDRKIISLVSRGIDHIRLYDYGPCYAVAEGSNSWSENINSYRQIIRGTHALGPADEILADGAPETRRVALLYNRTHEITSGGTYGVQADRALTFAALANAHHNADLILIDDLIPDKLKQYKIIYLNGFNLPSAAVGPLRAWVEGGGTLVCAAGSGMKDEYGDPLPTMEKLLGARQEFAGKSEGSWHPVMHCKHKAIDRVKLSETKLTPAMEADIIGTKVVLTPATAKGIATYADGSCAAALAAVGKGSVLTLGFMPGILYKGGAPGTSRYTDDRLLLVAKPAEAALGAPSVDCTAPQVEVSRFEHETGIAVTLNNFRYWEKYEERPVVELSVATDRQIKSVKGSLTGDLEWKRAGERIVISLPLPEPVEVVVLR